MARQDLSVFIKVLKQKDLLQKITVKANMELTNGKWINYGLK